MPQAIPAVIGAGASLIGSRKAKKAADADRAQQQAVIDALSQVEFDPQNIFGSSGLGFNFDTNTMSLGDFAPFQDLFKGLAMNRFQQGDDLQQDALKMGLPSLQQGMAMGTEAQKMAFNELLGAGGLDLGGLGLIREATGGFDDLRAQTLDTLRERDREGEDRAAAGLADRLFGSGRLGARTGSATGDLVQRDISDFGLGLARADLDRQLAATDVARQQQMQSATIGGRLMGLEDELLTNAFSRFGRTTDLTGENFGRLFNLGESLTGQGGNFLSSALGLESAGLDLAKFAANLAQSKSQVDINKAGGQTSVMSDFGPTGNDLIAGSLTSFGKNMFESGGGFGGIWDAVKGATPKGSKPTPAPTPK